MMRPERAEWSVRERINDGAEFETQGQPELEKTRSDSRSIGEA